MNQHPQQQQLPSDASARAVPVDVTPAQLKSRYVLALASTAAALVFAQLTIQPELSRQQGRLEAVNKVGRQRLLANQVSEVALSCALHGQAECAGPLARATNDLRTHHAAAVSSAELLLVDDAGLSAALATLVALVPPVLEQPDDARVEALRAGCRAYSAAIDEALALASGTLVKREQRTRLTIGVFGAAVIALIVLQALFVFRPAVRSITHQLVTVTRARDELQVALEHVKQLQRLLPICMHCKRIRDEGENWQRIESYLHEHGDVKFSHSICSECMDKYHPDTP